MSLAAQIGAETTAQVSTGGTSEASATPTAPAAGPQQEVGGANSIDTVEVDWGGAKRRVPLQELVKKAQEHDKALAKANTVEEMLQKQSAAAAFMKVIDSIPPEHQAAFAEVLRNPSLALKLVGQPPGKPAADEAVDLDEFVNGQDQQPRRQAPESEELRTLQRGVKVLLEDLQGRRQQEQQQTLAQRVDQSMAGFPVFEETKAGAKFARQSIMTQLAQNPSVNPDEIVAAHAAQLHGLLQEQRQQTYVPPRTGEPRQAPRFQVPDLDKNFTFQDLEAGRIGRKLLGR